MTEHQIASGGAGDETERQIREIEAWLDPYVFGYNRCRAIRALFSIARAALAENERLLRFAGKAIDATRFTNLGCDWDGGDLQNCATECGLLEGVTATAQCGDECRCAEYDDFPQTCLRLTELGKRAVGQSEERGNG